MIEELIKNAIDAQDVAAKPMDSEGKKLLADLMQHTITAATCLSTFHNYLISCGLPDDTAGVLTLTWMEVMYKGSQ